MKFACVELYTKSGRIWDGAREKPNYLCDPKTEIDNASFGCLTSALKGEHVPLLWFKFKGPLRHVYHNWTAPYLIRIPHAGAIVSKFLNRGFEKFHNLDYVSKFDVMLIVAHDFSIRAMAKFIVAAKKLRKKPIFLGAFGSPFNFIREALKDEENFRYFKNFIDNCDVFISCGHEAISEYLKLYTDTPVVNFPMFYPFEFAKSFFRPYQDKKKIIFVSGYTQKTDQVLSLLVAKKIQAHRPDFLIETIGHPRQNLEPLRGARFRVVPFLRWINYLKHASETYIIVDMDNTWTAGRVANDAAAVGTPCIGLNSGSQGRLFPDLTCSDVIDTKKAIDLGIGLIEDKAFYEKAQKRAFNQLKACSYENSVKRFQKMLETYVKVL